MNGFLFLLLNGSLTECKNRASRVCVCTAKQSADIGNDGYSTLHYIVNIWHSTSVRCVLVCLCAPQGNWLTLVESALVDMGRYRV